MVGSCTCRGRILAFDCSLLEWAGSNSREPDALRSELEKQSRQPVHDYRLDDRWRDSYPRAGWRRGDWRACSLARVETRRARPRSLPADWHQPGALAQRLSLVFYLDRAALMFFPEPGMVASYCGAIPV